MSYQMIDEISGLAEGHCGKVLADLRARQMGLNTFFAITRSLGIRAVFFADEKLKAQMAPLYEKRDQTKAHAIIARADHNEARAAGGRRGDGQARRHRA
jgi:hypothetical protein